MADKMSGSRGKDDDEEAKKMLSEHEQQKLSLDETRKSLPIYKYRGELLEAIKDHQVLIIEGQ